MAGPERNKHSEMSEEELRNRIAERAYYRAEQRGFAPGYEMEDWIEAEKEVRGELLPEEREPYPTPDDFGEQEDRS
jgi:hypothetical protein